MKQPFSVEIEFMKNVAGPNRQTKMVATRTTETVWAASRAQVRRIARGRFGGGCVSITPLWVEGPEMKKNEKK